MALVQSKLQSNLSKAFRDASKIQKQEPGCPPNIPQQVADLFSDAYDAYARDALTGALTVSAPFNKKSLSKSLVLPMLAGWGPGLLAYWSPATWAGPGLIPVNPMEPISLAAMPIQVAAKIVKFLANPTKPSSMDDTAKEIASILHSATITLKVITTTTSVPPVIAPIPVS